MPEDRSQTPAAQAQDALDLTPLLHVRQTHLDQILHADLKAAFLLLCYGAAAAAFVFRVAAFPEPVTHPVFIGLCALNLAVIPIGIGLLIAVMLPRLRHRGESSWWRFFVRPAAEQEEKTPTYFVGILAYTRDEFVRTEAIRLCSDRRYACEQMAQQIYVLAGICRTKFVLVGVAAHLLYVALFLTMLVVVGRW